MLNVNQSLNIGQSVFVVNKLYTDENGSFKIYISHKKVNKVEKNGNGRIIYTAGKHNELKFYYNEEAGYFQTSEGRKKRVFVTKEAAEIERKRVVEKLNGQITMDDILKKSIEANTAAYVPYKDEPNLHSTVDVAVIGDSSVAYAPNASSDSYATSGFVSVSESENDISKEKVDED